jgi:hypothetical protein
MSRKWEPKKSTVELDPAARPSRIRRDPLHVKQAEQLSQNAWWDSREWEVRLAIIGIVLFALGINAAVVDLGQLISH